MEEKSFSIEQSLRFGWKTVKENLIFFILVLLAVFCINVIPSAIREAVKEQYRLLAFLISISSFIIQVILSMGLVNISLRFCDGKRVEFSNLFDPVNKTLTAIVSQIVYGFIVVIGIILLIVPGIIWGIKYQFYLYAIVDRDDDPFGALKSSAAITQGHKGELFLFGLTLLGINILGLCAFIIGIVITIPVSVMAVAYAYRVLSGTQPASGEAAAGATQSRLVDGSGI
jgi:uncharacterized membrane protein